MKPVADHVLLQHAQLLSSISPGTALVVGCCYAKSSWLLVSEGR